MRIIYFLSFLLIFKLSILFSSAPDERDHVEVYRGAEISILKINSFNPDEETALADIYEVDSYTGKLDYPIDSPFGVYVAVNQAGKLVAIQSFGDDEENGILYASPTIRVLDSYQNRGYGSIMYAQTAKHISQFFGKPVLLRDRVQSNAPLSHIEAPIEWYFQDYPPVSSAIKGGYGVDRLDNLGNYVIGIFPPNATSWGPERVANFIKFAKIMQDRQLVTDDLGKMEQAMMSISAVISDLEFSHKNDLCTLFSIAQRVMRIKEGRYAPSNLAEGEICQAMHDVLITELFKRLSSEEFNLIEAFVTENNEYDEVFKYYQNLTNEKKDKEDKEK